jgi:Domain of unknown function (DU1801)
MVGLTPIRVIQIRACNPTQTMPKSTTKPTLSVADLLADYTPDVHALTEDLRHLIRATVPVASEAVYPVWRALGYTHPTCGYFCALFPQTNGVNLALEFGVLLPDPEQLLQGAGKQVRYVKMRSPADVRLAAIQNLLFAALDLPPSRAAKLALMRG